MEVDRNDPLSWALSRVIQTLLRLFFRRIEFEGMENVPASGPVLLVSNHSNAMLDPFFFSMVLKRRVWMTAKSTLASNPMTGWGFRLLSVIAFTRPQDLVDGQKPDNSSSIQNAVSALAGGRLLSIFAEGKSHTEPKLLPFRTGTARIALAARDMGAAVTIVPVGLSFEQKDRLRSDVYIRFGEALSLDAWMKTEREDPVGDLTRLMWEKVKPLCLSFSGRRQAWFSLVAARLNAGPRRAFSHQVKAALGTASRGEPAAERAEALKKLRKEVDRLGIAPSWPYYPIPASWARLRSVALGFKGLALLVPAAAGFLFHLPPALLVWKFGWSATSKRSHRTSRTLVGAFFMYPPWIALFLGAHWYLDHDWALAAALLGPLSGLIALRMVDWRFRDLPRMRSAALLARDPGRWKALRRRVEAFRA